MDEPDPFRALADIVRDLNDLSIPFGIVGGLAVSVRGEPRTTRDVDVAIAVDQTRLERLVVELNARRYLIYRLVEQTAAGRTATVRLISPSEIVVDLLAASSGIEDEVVRTATPVWLDAVGEIPVARAEELLALKVLSSSDVRLQDTLDVRNLLSTNPALDLDRVRDLLQCIHARGFDRGEDLQGKLEAMLRAAGR